MTYYPLFLYLKQLSAGERLQRTRGRAERREELSTSLRNSENWSKKKVGAGFLLWYFPVLKNLFPSEQWLMEWEDLKGKPNRKNEKKIARVALKQ